MATNRIILKDQGYSAADTQVRTPLRSLVHYDPFNSDLEEWTNLYPGFIRSITHCAATDNGKDRQVATGRIKRSGIINLGKPKNRQLAAERRYHDFAWDKEPGEEPINVTSERQHEMICFF